MKTSRSTRHVKRIGRYLVSGLLLMVLFQSVAMAQFSRLYNGDRVRVFAPGIHHEAITGTIFNITSTEIFLTYDDYTLIIPFTSIERLDVSLGKKSNMGKGALSGLIGGAAIGGFIGAFSYKPCDEEGFMACFLEPKNRRNAIFAGAAVGGLSGLVTGSLFGAIIKTDRWRRLPIEVSMNFPSAASAYASKKLSFSPAVSVKFSI